MTRLVNTGVRVLALLTAREVRVDTLTNAPSVLGMCDRLAVSGVPVACKLGFLARFVGTGRALLGVQVLDPGGEVLHVFSAEAEFKGRPINLLRDRGTFAGVAVAKRARAPC